MILWFFFAILTALAVLPVVSPYWRRHDAERAGAQDLAVYKQQLAEIDDEESRGLLSEAEAQAARIEVSRRILAADKRPVSGTKAEKSAYAPYVIVALIALLSMGTYLIYGSPHLRDQPLSARAVPQAEPQVESLIARVEERLKSHPDDGEGWRVIAPVYMRMGRYSDAANANRQALELLGPTPERLSDFAEAATLANGGVVTQEASAAFKKALAANPDDNRAEFWLAVEKEQSNELSEAAARYRKLLGRNLAANVQTIVNERLANVEARLANKPSAEAEPEQQAMIDSMVAGLAERLKADGSDLEGWLKLMRAYTVLGRREEALTAMKQAQSRFSGDSEALGRIDRIAKSLGLES
jgi:cytochrome c-type biogenesis protein CcmH